MRHVLSMMLLLTGCAQKDPLECFWCETTTNPAVSMTDNTYAEAGEIWEGELFLVNDRPVEAYLAHVKVPEDNSEPSCEGFVELTQVVETDGCSTCERAWTASISEVEWEVDIDCESAKAALLPFQTEFGMGYSGEATFLLQDGEWRGLDFAEAWAEEGDEESEFIFGWYLEGAL